MSDAPHPWSIETGHDVPTRIFDDDGNEVTLERAWREVQRLRSGSTEDRRAPDQTLTDHADGGGMPLLLVSNLGTDRPAFHLPSWEALEGDNDAPPTRCGQVDRNVFLSSLHVKHARWIGTACFDCFAA